MLRLTPTRVIGGVLVVGVLAAITVVGILYLAASCAPGLDRQDVVGTYRAKYPSGTETLTLSPDGRFFQKVVLKEPPGTEPFTRAGSWTWDQSEQIVRIPDCMAVNDGFGDIRKTFPTDRGCSFPVERKWWLFGQILLGDRDTAALWKVR